MKKLYTLVASLFVGLALFVWIGRTVGWSQIGNDLALFAGWNGLLIIILTFLIVLAGNWRWYEILKDSGAKTSFNKILKIYIGGYALMFLAPALILSGEIFRAFGLKKEYSLPWSSSMASVVTERILEWTANLLIIVLGLIFFLYNIGLPPKNLLIIFGMVFIFFVVFIGYFYIKAFRKESIMKTIIKIFSRKDSEKSKFFIESEKEVFNFFKLENKGMWKGFVLSFLKTFLMYLRIWIIILFLGEQIGLLPVLSILGFSFLAAMIPIPTSLGSHEAIQAFAFNSMDLSLSAATAFTMITRSAELIVCLVGVFILFRYGVKFIGKKFNGN